MNNRPNAMKTPPKPATKKARTSTKTPSQPRKLTVRQERFCELIASGKSGVDAWLEAGYEVSRDVARTNAAESLAKPRIQARIAELRKPQTKAALRKKEDNLRFLAEVIGTALADIGPDSPLCTEYTEEFIGGGARGKLKRGNAPRGNETVGENVMRRRVKKPDPLRAIELYSKLLGHFEPDRVEVETGPKTLLSIKERASQVSSALARRYNPETNEKCPSVGATE